ncbi:MAG: hypothetical protein CUN54_06425 [Phototrophicales bacterium]|nr:MAG: hypothetical protein CUN54_06425 [Phototrophicales bacterium]
MIYKRHQHQGKSIVSKKTKIKMSPDELDFTKSRVYLRQNIRRQFMQRKPSSFLTILPILATILLALSTFQAQGQATFRIGVLDEIDGPITKGAQLAIDEINAAGGARGADGTLFQLELIIQPTNNGQNLPTAVANLNQASVIAVLGPATTEEVLSNLPTLQTITSPVLTPAIGDTITTSDASGRIFRSRAAEALQGRALANYLIGDLGIRNIATIQLDLESTAAVIGFSNATTTLGVAPRTFLFDTNTSIDTLARNVQQSNPQIATLFGSPENASQLVTALRSIGWQGRIAYNRAEEDAFKEAIATGDLNGILSTTTWAFTSADQTSDEFLGNFTRQFGEIPGAVEAAAYDSIQLLAAAINRPGELRANLAALNNINGVQGTLAPAQLGRGETSNNVFVTQMNQYGAPIVVARFAGAQRLPVGTPIMPVATSTPLPTPTPAATATPEGVVATIRSNFQNVRSGPSTDFDILGQLPRGTQVQVIGANIDLSWIVIEFRGQQAWLSRSILDTFGDLNSLPIIQSPPTPTPPPTPTTPPVPDIVIDTAVVAPSPIIPGQQFIASVTVRNAGGAPAGQFAVAATFPPNDVFSSAVISGLGPGQSTIANLSATLTNTGIYTVILVADLNNTVNEGPGENNNASFVLNYTIDKPIIRQGNQTLNPGDTLDLEGNAVQGDVSWDGNALNGAFGAQLGIIPNVDINTIHWDLINPGLVNRNSIPRAELPPGTMVGVLTADGNRGFIRVESLPNNQIATIFRVYQN